MNKKAGYKCTDIKHQLTGYLQYRHMYITGIETSLHFIYCTIKLYWKMACGGKYHTVTIGHYDYNVICGNLYTCNRWEFILLYFKFHGHYICYI